MSRDPGDPGRPRKRKARPAPDLDPYETDTGRDFGAEEPTTFQPAPKRVAPTGGSTSKSRKKATSAGAGDKTPREETGGPNFVERIVFGSVGTGHLATFCRQFGAYLDAGVDLVRSLTNLQKQFARTALGPVISRLKTAVRSGDALSDAMAKEPQAFDTLFLSMVRVAEARGGLPEILRKMGDHYEARQRLMRQARSAMIYPSFVMLGVFLVGGLLTIFVLPKLIGILEDMPGVRGSTSLPLPTAMLIAFSHFIQAIGWWAIPVMAVGLLLGGIFAYRTPAGKAAMDEIALYIPVLGLLLRKIDTARFARTLSDLLDAGVDYGSAMDLTGDVLHLTPFRRVVHGARTEVVQGVELSSALAASRRFSPDVIAIIGTGEETGKLPETLDRLADDYEDQVQTMVRNLGHLLQPLILLVLGGIVFFIALAFVMAYVSVITNLASGGL